MRAVKETNPELDIRFIFQSENKKQLKWADKYGFPYAVGEIPEEWMK
jgi:hypothetical protein